MKLLTEEPRQSNTPRQTPGRWGLGRKGCRRGFRRMGTGTRADWRTDRTRPAGVEAGRPARTVLGLVLRRQTLSSLPRRTDRGLHAAPASAARCFWDFAASARRFTSAGEVTSASETRSITSPASNALICQWAVGTQVGDNDASDAVFQSLELLARPASPPPGLRPGYRPAQHRRKMRPATGYRRSPPADRPSACQGDGDRLLLLLAHTQFYLGVGIGLRNQARAVLHPGPAGY